MSNWYDAIYANDPSTDNIFGREALGYRRDALLHEYLRLGGRLGDFHAGVAAQRPVRGRDDFRGHDSMTDTHTGTCFCGAVEIAVSGQPAAMGYCHCASCRLWSAGPVNAFTLWPRSAVTVTKGADKIGSHAKTAQSARKWCTNCGGHLMTEHAPWDLTDVYAAVIPSLDFAPALHVHYQETVLPMRDGLPKHKDVPAEMGGSGVLLPE